MLMNFNITVEKKNNSGLFMKNFISGKSLHLWNQFQLHHWQWWWYGTSIPIITAFCSQQHRHWVAIRVTYLMYLGYLGSCSATFPIKESLAHKTKTIWSKRLLNLSQSTKRMRDPPTCNGSFHLHLGLPSLARLLNQIGTSQSNLPAMCQQINLHLISAKLCPPLWYHWSQMNFSLHSLVSRSKHRVRRLCI